MNFRTLKLRKNPDCPVCGTHPTVTELIDYDQFCGIEKPAAVGPLEVARDKAVGDAPVVDGIPQISVEELKTKLDAKEDFFVLDVREPHEYPIANLGAPLIPVGELEQRIGELAAHKDQRDHHPLPLRRPQPEGRAHPEEGRLQERRRTSPAASSPGPTRSTRPCRSTRQAQTRPAQADVGRKRAVLIGAIQC